VSTTSAVARRSGAADGFVVTLLNPSILTFYLLIVPSFIRPPGGLPAFALLAAIHVSMAFSCHLIWALAFDRLRGALSHPRARQTIDVLAGVALVLLALSLALRRGVNG
jgi:threonine/homoserine/homoserine lactone efflux protein